ncbi:hypothetical protein [Methylobacter sp. S3L5C]|uniref:hypothetical protein n=1 Tax=Methylobacter sp. S3L5C TaxID=2839024 RepID=UPI001FAE2879|nr:hypothetical protein [Methylobacter sp. S3L5C]UOA08130.1 hypothetical protein KKZ03_18205 [Methylobacter sp. S3L5C]
MKDKSSWQRFSGAENPLPVSKYQSRNDELGMIGVLAFNSIKTFKANRIKLLKQVGVKKTLVIFWE